MNLLCRLNRLPRPIRLAAAWLLIALGLPLFITPFPGGVVMVTVGALILYCAYPSLRQRISVLLLRGPKITARLAPLLSACDRCADNRPQGSCPDTPPLAAADTE